MAVLYLVPKSIDRETLKAAQWLVHAASQGKLRGLSVSYMAEDGAEDHFMTGLYRTKPAEAVRPA
jgi:hypothetical protein